MEDNNFVTCPGCGVGWELPGPDYCNCGTPLPTSCYGPFWHEQEVVMFWDCDHDFVPERDRPDHYICRKCGGFA